MSFRSEKTLNERITESDRILSRYPERRPVIVERSTSCSDDIPTIDKNKYLVPLNITMGQFLFVVRKRIKLETQETLYFFVNENVLVNSSQTMNSIYDSHQDEDGFLYLTYCSENVFG